MGLLIWFAVLSKTAGNISISLLIDFSQVFAVVSRCSYFVMVEKTMDVHVTLCIESVAKFF